MQKIAHLIFQGQSVWIGQFYCQPWHPLLSSPSSSATLPWVAFGLLAAIGGLIIWQQKQRKP